MTTNRPRWPAVAVVLSLLVAQPALAFTGQELSRKAKIGLPEARAIALKAHLGKVTDEDLERERGGSDLPSSFDIRNGSVTQEVGVDVATARVLENKAEGPNPDRP